MNARIYTGTLQGPEGTTVGRFVRCEAAHNLQAQTEYLLEALRMIAQAASLAEAQGIASDILEGHRRAIAMGGASH